MIEIKELMEEDVPRYTKAFLVARDLLGDFTGEYFKVFIDGKEKLLHLVEEEEYNLYTLYTLNEDGTISYDMFTTDKEHNVTQVGYEDFEASFCDGQTLLKYRDEKHAESLSVRKREVPDYDGLDGSIVYAQYDGDKDIRVIMTFNQMHFEKNKIVYENRVKTPFSIQIEERLLASQEKGKKAKSTSYISRTFDSEVEPFLHGLATVRDYGNSGSLGSSYSLQRGDRTTKYFKILFVTKDGNAITGFPFCKQYSQEQMEEMLTRSGFKPRVSKEIMDIHNGNDSTLAMCRELAAIMRDIRKDYEDVDCKKLELEIGFGSGENHENN